jgi:type I restriction-modification system DNA methylase subunit
MLAEIYSKPNGFSKEYGQFLTPPEIVDYMAKASVKRAVAAFPDRGMLQILDTACGTGRFMLGVADYCRKAGIDFLMWNIDIDPDMAEATRKHAIHYRIEAVIIHGDALLNRFHKAWRIHDGREQVADVEAIACLLNGLARESRPSWK